MFQLFTMQKTNILKSLPSTGESINSGDQNEYVSSLHVFYSLTLWGSSIGRVHMSGPMVLHIKLGKWDFMTECGLKEYSGGGGHSPLSQHHTVPILHLKRTEKAFLARMVIYKQRRGQLGERKQSCIALYSKLFLHIHII